MGLLVTLTSAQVNDSGAPATVFRVVEAERDNAGVFLEDGVHSFTKLTGSFPVDDPYLKNPALAASDQVIRHQLAYLAWAERMQVQHPIDRQLDGFIHERIEIASARFCF